MKSPERILNLIEELCTAEQIREVLSPAKGAEGVRVTAPTKHVLVHENLKTAIEKEAIGWESLYGLLNEAEENGSQHIFFFKSVVRSGNPFPFSEIAGALGYSGSKLLQFPQLDLIPNAYTISDLRLWGPAKPHDWVIKVYGEETRDFPTGRIVQENDGKYLKEFDQKRYRHVILIRWNAPDILEIRVPRDLSRRRIRAWLDQAWYFLSPTGVRSHLREWDLSRARAKLIEREETDTDVFKLNDTQVECEHHERATFESYDPQGNLFAGLATKTAIKDLIAANGKCTRLNVTWLPGPDAPFANDFRTSIGSEDANEVVIPAHCKSKDIEYVTQQLRKYGK